MKNSLKIYLQDIKSIGTNWVSAIIICALVLLPSLYAWLNIIATWDPYGRTDQIPVGIVNEDHGAILQSQKFNAGNELIKELQTNHEMNWQFTNRKLALERLEHGDYFSVIIIPKDFSHHLATVVNETPTKAQLDYYVNEKINSITPKITSKGASVLVDTMSSKFVGTVNGKIFEILNRLGITMKQDLPDIEKFKEYVFTLERDLPTIYKKLQSAKQDANSATQIINHAKETIPKTKELTSQGLSTVNETLKFINRAESDLNAIAPQVKKDMQNVQQVAKEADQLLKQLNQSGISFTDIKAIKTNLDNGISVARDNISSINQLLLNIKQYNEKNNNTANEATLNQAITQTENAQKIVNEIQTNSKVIDNTLSNKEQEITNSLNQLQQITLDTSSGLDNFINIYTETIEPTIYKQINTAKQTLTGAKNVLTDIQGTIPKVESLLNNTDRFLGDTNNYLNTFIGEYPLINARVHRLANQIRSFEKETDLNSLIQLLLNNPIAEKTFFEEPIKLKEHRVFPIENYGTGMSPFYSVLAIWVGCLLLISILAIDIEKESEFKTREVYFGKLLTFWTIGLLQTFIIVLGDLFILKISAEEPVWFCLFSLFISVVFMTIVYTLVSVFYDIGKALSVILLVLQLAGSGGTYPVELLPKFFQAINPYLPFTYAISMTREAIGGIIWSKIRTDFLFLFIVFFIIILFGSIFKKRINYLTRRMLQKSKDSGLFH